MSLTAADKVALRGVGLGLLALTLALLILLAPPLALTLLVFPAFGIAGWGLVGLFLAALVAWWATIRLYEFTRELLKHASLTLFAARMLRTA